MVGSTDTRVVLEYIGVDTRFFFSSRRRHTILTCDWSSDVALPIFLLAGLTFLPALLSILGRALFWPTHPSAKDTGVGIWGVVVEGALRRPAVVLVAGMVLFGVLEIGRASCRERVEVAGGWGLLKRE